MNFKAKIQRTIHAPVDKVWAGLTQPELVKQYFFGTDLVTSWQVQTPICFKGEWNGTAYEDKGTVLRYEPNKVLTYDYFSAWSGVEDKPENYQTITYKVKSVDNSTILTIEQGNIPNLERKIESTKNWTALMLELKKLMEK